MRKIAVGLLVALVLVAGACTSEEEPSAGPADDGPEGTVIIPAEGRDHVEGSVDYSSDPPAGGDHNAVPHTCGFYSEPIPSELAVHSLEHAAVWVTYGDDLPEEEVALLQARAGEEDKLLVAPYEGLDSSLVMTAWERQLELDSVSDPRFNEFIDAYMGGGVAPEPDAACEGVP